MIRRNNN